MRTVIVGNRGLAKHLLQETLASGWDVVGAVSPAGEMAKAQANYATFADVVRGAGCELVTTTDINDDDTVSALRRLDPDVCISGGWSQIIDERVLAIPSRGFLGFHSSKLPRGRGGAPINWSLINGADEVWLSLFFYDAGVDSGDVVARSSVDVEGRDDVGSVLSKLSFAAWDLLSAARADLAAGPVDSTTQSRADATYRPRRQPQDGVIDWDRPSRRLDDWVRALTRPYPGAFTFHDGQRLRIWDGAPVGGAAGGAEPGEVVDVVDGEGVDVRTGDGVFRVTRVQTDRGPARWADRYARSSRLRPGDRLGDGQAPADWLYTGIRDGVGGTRFESATNLAVGDRGEIQCLCRSGSRRTVDLRATFDGEAVREETLDVADRAVATVGYEPEEAGTHALSVTFRDGGRVIDERHLKVFAHG